MVSTREDWLVRAAGKLRPIFKRRSGWTVPDNVRVSCGFPKGGRRAIGQCWGEGSSTDGTFEVFISPTQDDVVDVLQVLVHELVHATVGIKAGHKGEFATVARAMALEGKLTATVAGETFKQEIAGLLVDKLGPYPHAALKPGGDNTGPKKQGTRLLKAFCPECEYTLRGTAKWFNLAVPACPNPECGACGSELTVEGN